MKINIFNIFKKSRPVKPVASAPVVPVAPVVPKIAPPDTGFRFVEPNTDRFLVPNDVTDIHSLFNYLVNRTINKDKAATEAALGEMDSFIRNNEDLYDLRHIPGLICTDGCYMIERGTDEDEYKFLMIKLNSWIHAAQSPFFNSSRGLEFIKRKLKKEAIEFVGSMSPSEVEDFLFNNILHYDFQQAINSRIDYEGKKRSWVYHPMFMVADSDFIPEHLESYAIRMNDGFSFANSVALALFDEIDTARDMFRGKRLFAVINNNVYTVPDFRDGHMIFNEHSFDEAKSRIGGILDDTEVKFELEVLDKWKNAVMNATVIPYISDAFKIKFIGL